MELLMDLLISQQLTGNYIFTWTADNGFTASIEDISNLSAGNYNLSVVDENDCPITLSK